jgi:hypothetical protein
MYSEGKSNYFKGNILMLAYGVVLMGGFYTPRYPDEVASVAGLERTGKLFWHCYWILVIGFGIYSLVYLVDSGLLVWIC